MFKLKNTNRHNKIKQKFLFLLNLKKQKIINQPKKKIIQKSMEQIKQDFLK